MSTEHWSTVPNTGDTYTLLIGGVAVGTVDRPGYAERLVAAANASRDIPTPLLQQLASIPDTPTDPLQTLLSRMVAATFAGDLSRVYALALDVCDELDARGVTPPDANAELHDAADGLSRQIVQANPELEGMEDEATGEVLAAIEDDKDTPPSIHRERVDGAAVSYVWWAGALIRSCAYRVVLGERGRISVDAPGLRNADASDVSAVLVLLATCLAEARRLVNEEGKDTFARRADEYRAQLAHTRQLIEEEQRDHR